MASPSVKSDPVSARLTDLIAQRLTDEVLSKADDAWGVAAGRTGYDHDGFDAQRAVIAEVLADDLAAVLAARETCGRPKVICLCGSTRFIDLFATATWELEKTGAIVLGCTLLPNWFCRERSHFAEAQGVKGQRDRHHLQKIDMADEVLVLDYEGYIGQSTSNEIAYATERGKPVRYVSKEPELLAAITRFTDEPSPPSSAPDRTETR